MGKFVNKLDRDASPVLLSLETAQAMLAKWDESCHIEKLELLSGGLRNTNYKVKLTDRKEPLVLRLCPNDLMRKEIAILQHIQNKVPVPIPLFTDLKAKPPYALISYIPGDTLDNVWDDLSNDELLNLFIDLGKMLAKIHSFRFSGAGYLDEHLTIVQKIDNLGEFYFKEIYSLFTHLKTLHHSELEFVTPLLQIIKKDEEMLRTLSLTNRLVHCDFNPKNIMVNQEDNQWKISGIIDWEFSFSGSPLIDIGNFLRFEDEMPAETKDYFMKGYFSQGRNLPTKWRKISLILDLAVIGEFLGQKEQKPRSFETGGHVGSRTVEKLRLVS